MLSFIKITDIKSVSEAFSLLNFQHLLCTSRKSVRWAVEKLWGKNVGITLKVKISLFNLSKFNFDLRVIQFCLAK